MTTPIPPAALAVLDQASAAVRDELDRLIADVRAMPERAELGDTRAAVRLAARLTLGGTQQPAALVLAAALMRLAQHDEREDVDGRRAA